jgi:hypothetical protein
MKIIDKFAIVFVHLGDNPSPTLIPFAKFAIRNNPESEFFLITDSEHRWSDFPGRIIVSKKRNKSSIKHLIQRSRYNEKIAGGYWVKTYERLFALSNLYGNIDPNLPIIHIESDVLLQDAQILKEALNIQIDNEIAVPRMSEDLGIASILYSRNIQCLLTGLKKLDLLGRRNPGICTNDMKLLGLALNQNIISELPTWSKSKKDSDIGNKRWLFDGAAIGQYLFGRDPIHTENVRLSGYENPSFPIRPSSLSWHLEKNIIHASDGENNYYFANLHIHSKEIIGHPASELKRWVEILEEANGVRPRSPSEFVNEEIHTRGYSPLVKLEIFLRTRFKRKNEGKSELNR